YKANYICIMKELRGKIIKWADDKGILSKATPATQATKILEECLELVVADLKQDREEIIDACGDIATTLVIEAKLIELPLDEVFHTAYEVDDYESFRPNNILATASNIIGAVGSNNYSQYNHTTPINTAEHFIESTWRKLLRYCDQEGLEISQCLQSAYDVINKRT